MLIEDLPLQQFTSTRPEDSLLQKCLEHLKALPDIQVTVAPALNVAGNMVADGQLTIHGPVRSINYLYEIKPDITGTTAELVISHLKLLEQRLGQKLLLITRYLSNPAINRFIDQNTEFIDTAGNIYLNSSAAYVLIRGKPRPKEKPSSRSKITANTLKLIYIVLKSPSILESPYKELANAAGVGLACVGQTLRDLFQLGYVQRQWGGKYRIANYTKLLERWEMGYAESLRPKLLLGTFTPASERSFSDIAQSISRLAKEEGFLIGGELGAAIATSYLRPNSVTLHVWGNHLAIAIKLKLKPRPQGEITFLQQFGTQNAWTYHQSEPVADPLLIHAELLMENDDRLRETAERLFTKYIADRQTDA